MRKKFLLKLLLVLVITAYPHTFLKAQQDPPDGDPDEIPLDPGSWVLVAAGVGYGVKKWRDSQQNNKRDIYKITDCIEGNTKEEKSD